MSLVLVTLRLGGETTERPLIDHPSGASVLAYDPVRRVGFVTKQTRLAVLSEGQAPLFEAVGGVNEDEDPAETAKREAQEEIGLELRKVEFVGKAWMTPSSTTERVSFFLAEYGAGDQKHSGGGAEDENEELLIAEMPLADLWATIERGETVDAKLMLLLQALRLRRPELFEA